MSQYTKEELKAILKQHKMWLENPETGKRADFMDCNLAGANLSGADMTGADMTGHDF